MDEGKKYENDHSNYTIYVHCYWLPLLEQKRSQGLIQSGKIILEDMFGNEYKYEGEIDQNGQAFGYGIATDLSDHKITHL